MAHGEEKLVVKPLCKHLLKRFKSSVVLRKFQLPRGLQPDIVLLSSTGSIRIFEAKKLNNSEFTTGQCLYQLVSYIWAFAMIRKNILVTIILRLLG